MIVEDMGDIPNLFLSSEVMNLKFYNITSGKVQILYLACPMFAESNRTVLNSWKF